MNIIKELPAISWQVDEPSYRADPALSYSTLAKYEKEGFNKLNSLFEKTSSPSLTFGSAVDAIITGGKEEFEELFDVLDISITDSGISIAKQLESMKLPFERFEDIPESIVSEAAKEVGFWKADKWDKIRYKKVFETGDIGTYYYTLMNSAKTIIDTNTYQDVLQCVRALKESEATRHYFADNQENSYIKRYYQSQNHYLFFHI